MMSFGYPPIMDEEFLKELNIAIDNIIEEIECDDFDYCELENVLKAVIKRRMVEPSQRRIKLLHPMKREEMNKICLNFFESLDSDIFKHIKEIFFNLRENMKTNVYDIKEVEDFSETDENGIPKYTYDGTVWALKGNAIVHLPYGANITYVIKDAIGQKEECSLQDLYVMVHELSHTLDLRVERTIPKVIENQEEEWIEIERNETREILTETTASVFEKMLTDYLIKHKICSPEVAIDVHNECELALDRLLKLVYAKIVLVREKEETGEITLEYLQKIMEEERLTPQYIREMAEAIIENNEPLAYQRRYAIASILSATIYKKYKEDPKKGVDLLKEYIRYTKENKLDSALGVFGIKLEGQSLEELIQNKSRYQKQRNEIYEEKAR